MTEERTYPQITNETVQAWAETVGVSDLSDEILRSLTADATYRLQEVLNVSLAKGITRKLKFFIIGERVLLPFFGAVLLG